MDVAPLDSVLYYDFATSSPVSSSAVNADSTPTFAVYENGASSDIGVGGNASNLSTGLYGLSFTCSAANGFELGKCYNVVATAIVGGITGKKPLGRFRLIAAETTAGYPVGDTHANLTGSIVAGSFAAGAIDNAAIAADAIGSSELATTAVNEIRDAILSDSTPFAGAKIALIDAKTTNLPSDPADESLIIAATDAVMTRLGSPAGVSVSADIAAVLTAVPTANANADALLDRANGIETGWTFRQVMKVFAAMLGGKISGADTSTPTVRDITDNKNRISWTADSVGNRTSVTFDLT